MGTILLFIVRVAKAERARWQQVLVDLGVDAKSAIQSVREARPGAIENSLQEGYILGLKG
jgi:hypothetical protein